MGPAQRTDAIHRVSPRGSIMRFDWLDSSRFVPGNIFGPGLRRDESRLYVWLYRALIAWQFRDLYWEISLGLV